MTAMVRTWFCVAATLLFMSPSIVSAQQAPKPPQSPGTARPAAGDLRVPSRFLVPARDDPHPFKTLPGSNPQSICDKLDEAGFSNLGWREAQVAGLGWECIATQNPVPEGDATATAAQNEIFYVLRGRSRQRISSARLKINAPQQQGRAELFARAAKLVDSFARTAGVEASPGILDAVRMAVPFEHSTSDATFTMKREFGDEVRFNLSIDFGVPKNAFRNAHGSAPPAGTATAPAQTSRAQAEKTDRVQRSK